MHTALDKALALQVERVALIEGAGLSFLGRESRLQTALEIAETFYQELSQFDYNGVRDSLIYAHFGPRFYRPIASESIHRVLDHLQYKYANNIPPVLQEVVDDFTLLKINGYPSLIGYIVQLSKSFKAPKREQGPQDLSA